MKLLVTVLSFFFSGLEMVTAILIFPLTLLCAAGLIGFTIKIARDMKARGLSRGPLFEADRLHA